MITWNGYWEIGLISSFDRNNQMTMINYIISHQNPDIAAFNGVKLWCKLLIILSNVNVHHFIQYWRHDCPALNGIPLARQERTNWDDGSPEVRDLICAKFYCLTTTFILKINYSCCAFFSRIFLRIVFLFLLYAHFFSIVLFLDK